MPTSSSFTTRPVYMGTHGVIAAGHYLAARAGQRMFDRGGNAIDAAVASGFALNVLEPQSCGIGGEVPILIYSARDGKPFLTKEAKLLLNDNNAGRAEGIQLMIGRRPYAAFGNSTGDRQMLEWTGAGSGARLKMLLLHDDAAREYAYGPAQGLPDSRVGTFTPALYGEAKKKDWKVISMNDWRRVFAFEN